MTDLNKFLNTFKKSVEKMPEVGTSSEPPAYWLPSGNYVQNYIMSGNFRNAIPQGRIVSFAGPSGCLVADETISVYKLRSDTTFANLTTMRDAELLAMFEHIPPTMRDESADVQFAYITEEFAETIKMVDLYNSDQKYLVSTPDGFQPIVEKYKKDPRPIVELTFATTDQSPKLDTIKSSDNHLYQLANGEWVAAGELKPGDFLLSQVGGIAHVVSTEVSDPDVVYDIQVGHPNSRYWSKGLSSHNSGKSYNVASACAAAIREGYIVLVVDSEDALDDGYMQGCGVDTESPLYNYTDVMTIPQCQKVVSTFISDYRAAFGNDLANAPKVLIAIDSLDMLMTETEHDNTRKGVSKGDQGQKNRQLKAMLRGFVHLMKDANISIITTSQVYKNQDLLNGEGVWVVGEAVKYAASTIIMVTKLKLRDASEVRGIRMKLEGYKTRFTKPFQTVTIELDYEKGIDEYSGLIDVAVGLGVLDKRGSRVGFVGDSQSFYAKDIGDHIDRLLSELDELTAKRGSDIYLEADLDGAEEMGADGESTKERRRNKVQAAMEAEADPVRSSE